MIVVIARVETDPESIADMSAAIATMETASRAEAGCHDYAFSVDLSDQNVMRITERWEDMAALEAHFKTPHMASFNAALSALKPKAFQLHCLDATEVPLPSSR